MKDFEELDREILQKLSEIQMLSNLRAIEAKSGCSRSTLSRLLRKQGKPTECSFQFVINLCQALFIDMEVCIENDGK